MTRWVKMKGRIADVFCSFQGEGLYLGESQIFIRFFDCNLKCRFCDTRLTNFSEYTPEGLLERINSYDDTFHSLSFTGGEPLLQKDFLREISALTHYAGFKNYLETNGTLADELGEVIDYFDFIAMDLKLPSSTGLQGFWEQHRRFLKVASHKEVFLKAVICESTVTEDILEAVRLIKEIKPDAVFFLQPNSLEEEGFLEEKAQVLKDIVMGRGIVACVVPQLHKIVGIK